MPNPEYIPEFASGIPPKAIDVLDEVPMDHDIAQRLVGDLEQHGAKVIQSGCYRYMATIPGSRRQIEKLTSNHRIEFPVGTLIYYGIMLGSSQSFRIKFPDEFQVYGIKSYITKETKTILFLPSSAKELE